jgi:hypothetical protein
VAPPPLQAALIGLCIVALHNPTTECSAVTQSRSIQTRMCITRNFTPAAHLELPLAQQAHPPRRIILSHKRPQTTESRRSMNRLSIGDQYTPKHGVSNEHCGRSRHDTNSLHILPSTCQNTLALKRGIRPHWQPKSVTARLPPYLSATHCGRSPSSSFTATDRHSDAPTIDIFAKKTKAYALGERITHPEA